MSGKQTNNYGKSPFLNGKTHKNSVAIFNSKLLNYQRSVGFTLWLFSIAIDNPLYIEVSMGK